MAEDYCELLDLSIEMYEGSQGDIRWASDVGTALSIRTLGEK
jgi:hypothetical protein